MHTIDHYCYHSGLRGVNAGLKFAYAAATMLICLISRSLAAAALVLLANGILTVKKGRIPFPFYRKLMLVPLAFLILGTAAMILNLSKTPLDAYAVSIGSWYPVSYTHLDVYKRQMLYGAVRTCQRRSRFIIRLRRFPRIRWGISRIIRRQPRREKMIC